MLPQLSIIIPIYNAEVTLAEQARAVVQGMDAGMELLLVDNRSTDRSREIASWFAERYPNVHVVDASRRQGEPYARNVGVGAARSESLAFCDADDVVGENWAVAMRRSLEHADYVTGPVDIYRLNPPWLAEVRGRLLFSQLAHTDTGIPIAHGCNFGVRRSLLEKVGGFDESVLIGCDVDLSIRSHRAGCSLAWDDEAVVHYRHRSTTRERWGQAVAYGRANHHLRALEGESDGIGRRVVRQARRVGWLLRTVPLLGRRDHRAKWLWFCALVVGEIRGGPK